MPVRPVAKLMAANFVLVDISSSAADLRAAIPFGSVAVVTVQGMPVGVLTEDRLLAIDALDQPLASLRRHLLTVTLTVPNAPIASLFTAMVYTPSVRWHVVRDGDRVVGVVSPSVLFDLLNRWQQTPPQRTGATITHLLEAVRGMTLGMLLRLAGDPLQPPPQLCALCPATTPPHRLQLYEVDYANPVAPTCKLHPPTTIVWANPCSGG
jgi:hypothetical protein